ncbi:hypothetical protein, variant [Spizellomyces punctatus DAOM BR117]|uniref:RRM domain-containing protein n=1 Tax=Spizellomyces punctatus (strain DAOM BR117) TaxID=645134 RepID=A0A0L0HPB8_SPIPD|nr:hypothetical protein, variant [Spizellomyces punctatus DAOM BR117]KND02937.1 hypothetical protein, variant [Spizellomyces punctatus DAOM BR117]|eukprot:XP_016610976.1 hypothetical protein, variant [Spizellomyces punctatus DAOM BR117]
MASGTTVKVANVSSYVTEELLKQLFEIIGTVRNFDLHPSPHNDGLQECEVEFGDATSAITALHLTGTDLGDRTLFVTTGGTDLPAPINKAEEIARTVYVGNINSNVTEEDVRQCFGGCGPIAHVKMAGDPGQVTRFAFVEFITQEGASEALKQNGIMLGDRALKVNHSKNAINKTPKKLESFSDPAMKLVAEAQAAIAKKYGSERDSEDMSVDGDRDRRSMHRRSRSRSRSKPSERYRPRRSPSYDRRRRRSRSRSWDRRRRSRSRSPLSRRRASRTRSRDRSRYQSRDRSPGRSRDDRKRDDSRLDRSRKEKDRNRDRSGRERDKNRDGDKHKERTKDRERKKDRDGEGKEKSEKSKKRDKVKPAERDERDGDEKSDKSNRKDAVEGAVVSEPSREKETQ